MATSKEEAIMLFERLLDGKDSFFKSRLEKAYTMVTMWKGATLRALDSFQFNLDQAEQVSDEHMSIEHRLIAMDMQHMQRKAVILDKVLSKIQGLLEDPHPQKTVSALKTSSLRVQKQADVDNLLGKTQKYWTVYGKKIYHTSMVLADDYSHLFNESLRMLEKDLPSIMNAEDHEMVAANCIQENMEIFQGLLHGAIEAATAADHCSRRGVQKHEAVTWASNPGFSHIMDDEFTWASNTVQTCSSDEQHQNTGPQSIRFPKYTPDGRTPLGPAGQTPNGLSHNEVTGIDHLFCVESRPGEAQTRESRIKDEMDQWNAEDDALRRKGLSFLIPTPKPFPRTSPWIPDDELQARRFTKCSKIGVEERADGGYPNKHVEKTPTSLSDQDEENHKYKEYDSGSANLQTSHPEHSSGEIEGKKKKKKSAVKIMKGFINSPVSSVKSAMNKVATATEHQKDKDRRDSDRYTSATKDVCEERNEVVESTKIRKQKSKKNKVKNQIQGEEEQEYCSGSGTLHTFHVAYPEDFNEDAEGRKGKNTSAVKLMKGFVNSPVSSTKSMMDKVTTVIEHHKDKARQFKHYDSDDMSDQYTSTNKGPKRNHQKTSKSEYTEETTSSQNSLYPCDLDESDEEYGELDFGQDHYVNVSNINDVTVLAIRNRHARHKLEMSLRKGMVIKQKRCQNEQKMSYGWKRSKHGQKKYGYYPADDVVLYPSKENYDEMDLPFNIKKQNGRS